jgi:hypothetical protein
VLRVIGDVLALRRDYRDWKRQQRAGREERIQRRQRIKGEITLNLPPSRPGYAPELIVRDLARVDVYPELDDSPWGISPWFKVEGKGVYHRGLEVFLSVVHIVIDGSVARHPSEGETAGIKDMFVVGRVPFDAIVTIDWEGDEYNPMPHVYCWFDQVDGPYESIMLYERGYQDHLFLRDDLRYRPPRRSRWRQWRDHRELKTAQRAFEREAAQLSGETTTPG